MFIERICPTLVPAIRQAFDQPKPVVVDDVIHALILFGDSAMLLGFVGAFLLALMAWIGRDVVAFVRRNLAYRSKHAD